MIIAIGSDLCNIERIQHSLTRWGERFENRAPRGVNVLRTREPYRAFVTVAHQIDHGLAETIVAHVRHGDEKLAPQRLHGDTP